MKSERDIVRKIGIMGLAWWILAPAAGMVSDQYNGLDSTETDVQQVWGNIRLRYGLLINDRYNGSLKQKTQLRKYRNNGGVLERLTFHAGIVWRCIRFD